MIGDSLDHDVAGAARAGMLTLLLRSGVHRDQARRPSAGADVPMPDWTMHHLAW
ncbi:HAD hydrolase-like protein, partial [Bradyrhizobium sp. SHOUNA76]